MAVALALRDGDPAPAGDTETVPVTDPSTRDTSGDTTPPEQHLVPLPRPDFDAYCVETFGLGNVAVLMPASKVGCRLAGFTSAPTEISPNDACAASVAEGSTAIVPSHDETWRCTPSNSVELGLLDFDAACKKRTAESSRAVLIADDWMGWRCAVIGTGVFLIEAIDYHTACALLFGAESYAHPLDETADGWRCYASP